jgi:hypothetical protein
MQPKKWQSKIGIIVLSISLSLLLLTGEVFRIPIIKMKYDYLVQVGWNKALDQDQWIMRFTEQSTTSGIKFCLKTITLQVSLTKIKITIYYLLICVPSTFRLNIDWFLM